MGNYRNISVGFWTDPKVEDDFSPEDKYFYLYLLTNPHTNICGCYEESIKQMSRETGYNEDTIARLLSRLEASHDVIKYSHTTKEVLLPNWGKYNWSRSEKVGAAVISVGKHIKCDEFREYVLSAINEKIPGCLQITDNRLQITDTDISTDVSIGYGYPIHRVSQSKKKNVFCDYPQSNTDLNDVSKRVFKNV